MGRPPFRAKIPNQSLEEIERPQNARISDTTRVSWRERAERRKSEIGDAYRRAPGFVDKFEIPRDVIPDGWTMEWKRHSTYGQVDQTNLNGHIQDGWEYATSEDFPDAFHGFHQDGMIINEGMVLMMIPDQIAKERRNMMHKEALAQVQDKRKALGESVKYDGFQIDRKDFADGKPEYGPIPKE